MYVGQRRFTRGGWEVGGSGGVEISALNAMDCQESAVIPHVV